MKYKKILITGGAGFVGSNLTLRLRDKYPDIDFIVLDNLIRKGSELNVPRLKEQGVNFIKGDVRNSEDLDLAVGFDLIIECSAECSVLAGYNDSARYLIDTNLMGAVNCLEFAKKNSSDMIFLSTSRVYPIEKLKQIPLDEGEFRFSISQDNGLNGIRNQGISEDFPLEGVRSFYGASKLAAELMIAEYTAGYGIKSVINRCGVIAGPWQMGKVDQGVMALWVARHIFKDKLTYIGFSGKQVRDILHIEDLYNLIDLQINNIETYNGGIFNVGGGIKNSVSLRELTVICQKITGEKIDIDSIDEIRQADIPYYVTDFSKINALGGWKPKRNVYDIVKDIADWILKNKQILEKIFQ